MKLINDYSCYNVILWKKNGLIRRYEMLFLSFEFLDEDFDYIMFLKFDFPLDMSNPNINDLITPLESIFNKDENTFVLLTNRKKAPIYKERPDEFIYSFSCNFHHFRDIADRYVRSEFLYKNLLFELLDQIFMGNSNFRKVLAKQIPIQIIESPTVKECDVIIPHRGDNAYLHNLLLFLHKLNKLNIYVGVDQNTSEDLLDFQHSYPKTSFYNFNPNPVGPYVIRNRLIAESSNELLFFQDSDDIPCADRFSRISNHMNKNECQLCGSHEIKLDYYDKTVRAVRYPTNVIASLKEGPGHSLLHPSSAITRTAFHLCEKLSEERIFGNDTKFLYHSFFILNNIQNIDEFLYIRRRHPNSLTTSPDTMIGSKVRQNLLLKWVTDFALVKSGQLKLEDSSLTYEPSKLKFDVKKL